MVILFYFLFVVSKMQSKTTTLKEYISQLPSDRKAAIDNLRQVINKNLPSWFVETMQYGMIARVVPHTLYPAWYHCKPLEPLPFLALASQKNFIALYHMGIYADEKLLVWFQNEFPKHSKKKLDMWKSCIRFKDSGDIPFSLIEDLVKKMNVDQRVSLYEKQYKKA